MYWIMHFPLKGNRRKHAFFNNTWVPGYLILSRSTWFLNLVDPLSSALPVLMSNPVRDGCDLRDGCALLNCMLLWVIHIKHGRKPHKCPENPVNAQCTSTRLHKCSCISPTKTWATHKHRSPRQCEGTVEWARAPVRDPSTPFSPQATQVDNAWYSFDEQEAISGIDNWIRFFVTRFLQVVVRQAASNSYIKIATSLTYNSVLKWKKLTL